MIKQPPPAPETLPRVSVIIPVYNVAEHVVACIQSLRAQTLDAFEAIVIDDGSTDDSGAVAQHAIADDPRFRLIRQENAGLSGARNTGLGMATGAYIAFVDSDDRVMPDYLMRLWQTLEQTGGDWVACAIQSNSTDGTGGTHSAIHGASDLSRHVAPTRYPFETWSDVICHFPSAWNKLYRRTLIEGLRFDEGTWFEDHGFFHRAAARTDHIIHLPEALYIQTRGREGQITTTDDDRVFEQFDVLGDMQKMFAASPRPGGDLALARIASRLVFERSTIVADPARRTRFAAAARDFLHTHNLKYETDWDNDIALSWGQEMAGTLPLSVILSWDGLDTDALHQSLDGLRTQTSPAHEVLIICQTAAAHHRLSDDLEIMPHWHIHTAPTSGEGAGFNHGLTLARGVNVIFLATGDTPTPWSFLQSVEAMLRADADFGLSQMRLYDKATDVVSYHNGIHDMSCWNVPHAPPTGPLDITPLQALTLEAHCSAKIFRRAFLVDVFASAPFTAGPRPDWALCLIAALRTRAVTYIAQASMTVPMTDQGFDRWRAPHSAGALRKGHRALLENISAHFPDIELPQGWQRRLFARALREQVYFGQYATRISRLAVLAGAAFLSAHRGYGAPRQAGLDPAVGPRLSRMMTPAAVLLRRKTVHDAAVPPLPGKLPRAVDTSLHAFDLRDHGVLAFQATFCPDAPYANIFFYTKDRRQVVFHLSLRQTDGVAVCNDQRPDGQWRAERPCPIDLSSSIANVRLTFNLSRITVEVNDTAIFHFGPRNLLNRTGFSRLDTIAGFTVEGDVIPRHVMPDIPNSALALDSRLMVRVSQTTPDSRLTINTHTGPELIPDPAGNKAAILPARFWQDGLLNINHAGNTLTITRADMAARIEALLTLPLAPKDTTLCTNLLEHVRHGDLTDLLSTTAHAQLARIAAFYNIRHFIQLPLPAPMPLPADPVNLQVDTALSRLSQSQTAAPDHRPDALSVVAAMQVSDAAQQPLLLALAEYFCVKGRDFDGLYRLAQQRGMLPLNMPADRWSLSAALPYLSMGGEYEQMSQALAQLAELAPDWPVTPAIAWAVRHTLTETNAPDDLKVQIFNSFSAFIRTRAPDYWDRAHCRMLTHTVATLIKQLPNALPQDALIALCLEVYGLSRQFWSDVADAPLPPQMQSARTAYAHVMSDKTPAADRAQAMQLFDAAGTLDAPRIRREIFGPAGAPSDQLAQTAPHDILRHMASPNSTDIPPPLARCASNALPTLYPETPCAPDFTLQHTTTSQAMAWLENPIADLAPLTKNLGQLTGKDAHHLGLGMALALVDAVHDIAPDQARTLCDWLRNQTANQAPSTWHTAPALRSATRRLRARVDLLPELRSFLDDMCLFETMSPDIGSADLPAGHPLFDTIITVFSCAPYLDTRIPALRRGWLSLLDTLGIPYVIVVGNGDGTRHGDTLHLDAPDDYEGLPQKTLATIKWVHDNTRFGHMLKIDDDCFLNADLFFKSLTYTKFDYYGRRLHRIHGQTDRIWHQGKSTTARGRMDLDKSPEPSEYADGGSAYSLSRTAMTAALDAANSPEGQQLIAVSFMEDKMLGDLLAMRGIHVADEDYRVSIRRRTHRDAIPVASWLNSFHASPTAPLQLVHLDTHLDQATALDRLAAPELSPHKIWPSYQEIKLGHQTNALELITSEQSVARACAAPVAVVACMRNEMFMLPQFLAHYRKLGVDAFLIADNCSDDGTLEYLAQQPDVALFSVDTDYNASHYGVAWQQAMLAAFRLGKWSLVADADELLVWQENQTQTLPDLLNEPEFQNADAVRLFMLDMYPKGPLEDADFTTDTPFAQAGFADRIPFLTNTLTRGPHSNQQCWTSALRHRLIPGSRVNLFVAQKLALLRYNPAMRLSAGLHFVGDASVAPRELLLAHFKYNADFRRKAQAEVTRGQHFNDAEEYRKYLALTSEGRSVIYDDNLSIPWSEVPFVKSRLT